MKRLSKLLVVLGISLVLVSCSTGGMGMESEFAEIPVGVAYADSKEIYFMHTEASDEKIAELLTAMMDSPVLFVPELAEIPDEALANVFVFSNGIEGMGPLGYQSDVFDAPPGTDFYSPLRKLNLVSWVNPEEASLVQSLQEILTLESQGKVKIEQPGVVINMPFVVWDGGMR